MLSMQPSLKMRAGFRVLGVGLWVRGGLKTSRVWFNIAKERMYGQLPYENDGQLLGE